MSGRVRHVGISFGSMEGWHDGLGEFSRQLGQRIAAQAERLQAEQGITFHLHLPERWHGYFGEQVRYLPLHWTQRVVHLSTPRFDLWHTLHQHNRYRPPVGARQRLLTVHDLNFLYVKHPRKIARYLWFTQRLLNRQTAVVAISRFVRDDVVRHLRLSRTPQVIYNGATDLTQCPQDAVDAALQPGFLLHISRMVASKNVACLLELAAVMPQQRFVFAGPRSPASQEMIDRVRERGLTNVRVLESVSEAQKTWLYAHCCGFLFPSLTEGFGLPPLEAMYFGKPAFLSRLTSLPEVGGDVAHYFDRFEPESMRATVEAGLAAHAVPGQAAVVMAHARQFSWTRCADAYLALYLQLLEH